MAFNEVIREVIEEMDRVFHNETDFQVEFSRRLGARIKGGVRPEFPFENPLTAGGSKTYVDVVCFNGDDIIAIELKYPKDDFQAETSAPKRSGLRESFDFNSVGAYDMAMYPFWKDVEALEKLVKSGTVDDAYALQLTNYQGCWTKDNPSLNGAEFYLYEGRTVSGTLEWDDGTSEKTKEDYPAADLTGTYQIEWAPYHYTHPTNDANNKEFKHLLLRCNTETKQGAIER